MNTRLMPLIAVIISSVVLLSAGVTPIVAGTSAQPVLKFPAPLEDISKAVPFSHPLDNVDNPSSPNYDPSFKYGAIGTRFGPPGQRTPNDVMGQQTPLSPNYDGWFGTYFKAQTSVDFVYAVQSISSSVTPPSDGVLYAPSLMAPANCSVEITSRYWVSGGVTNRTISVWDHNYGAFKIDIPTSAWSDYVNNGHYLAEVMCTHPGWHAVIYNWTTGLWEDVWHNNFNANTGTNGWCWFEYKNFDSQNWPELGANFDAYNIMIKLPGQQVQYASSTYAQDKGFQHLEPYSSYWYYSFSSWSVTGTY